MTTATVVIDRDFVVSSIDRRIFGSFSEHMGRSVYGGIYDPGDPLSDGDGFRKDVIALVQELGVTIVRYPGGNFLSGYDWRDGVGPAGNRPQRLDLAWHSLETNEFGLDEFMNWCSVTGVEPMMAANLGTGSLRDAVELLEYCNADARSRLAQQRAENGHPDPYGVKVWCLGNEMDGPWQLGHRTAKEYGRIAADVARGMRMLDPGVELVACGSSYRAMPSFAAWEDAVLEECYELVDYVSLHAYYEIGDDLQSFLASATDLDSAINEVCAVADSVKARKRSDKVLQLSLDEWNVWYLSRLLAREAPTEWEKAPRLSEDDYTAADAVVVGNMLVSMLRRADRVKMACLAQLVNTIAPIRADPGTPAWRQTTFYPFALTARYAQGDVLTTRVSSPSLTTSKYGTVAQLDAVATVSEGSLAVFLVNRSADAAVDVAFDLRGFGPYEVVEHVVLHDRDPLRSNTSAEPNAIVPESGTSRVDDGRLVVTMPQASWSMLRLELS